MNHVRIPTLSTPLLLVGLVTATLLLSAASVSASEGTKRLHIREDCSQYTGQAGSSSTVSASNIADIPVGSKVFYDQAADNPAGLLDSNIVLDAGNGNRAVGRCTLDLATGLALCLFFDGTGTLAGFHARIDGKPGVAPDTSYHWNGRYSFAGNDQ